MMELILQAIWENAPIATALAFLVGIIVGTILMWIPWFGEDDDEATTLELLVDRVTQMWVSVEELNKYTFVEEQQRELDVTRRTNRDLRADSIANQNRTVVTNETIEELTKRLAEFERAHDETYREMILGGTKESITIEDITDIIRGGLFSKVDEPLFEEAVGRRIYETLKQYVDQTNDSTEGLPEKWDPTNHRWYQPTLDPCDLCGEDKRSDEDCQHCEGKKYFPGTDERDYESESPTIRLRGDTNKKMKLLAENEERDANERFEGVEGLDIEENRGV